jgi:large subunit ribosomal protein L24
MILAGKDKGEDRQVLMIRRRRKKFLVEDANKSPHTKANPYANQPGGIIEKEAPVHVSNVAVVCNACAKPTRVGYRVNEDGKKVRFCKKCNETIQ